MESFRWAAASCKADVLLSCEDHDDKEFDCKNCHLIGHIRQKTADLVIRARNLA